MRKRGIVIYCVCVLPAVDYLGFIMVQYHIDSITLTIPMGIASQGFAVVRHHCLGCCYNTTLWGGKFVRRFFICLNTIMYIIISVIDNDDNSLPINQP